MPVVSAILPDESRAAVPSKSVRSGREHMFVPRSTRFQQKRAAELIAAGWTDPAIAGELGLDRSTICRWRNRGLPRLAGFDPQEGSDWRPSSHEAYSYLLGLYLGDGCVVRLPRTYVLVIALDGLYPELVQECVKVAAIVVPDRVVRVKPGSGRGIRVEVCSALWPHVFPQHGPGPKHRRRIELVDWQRAIVDEHPEAFVRGLIHSDGCRCVNEFTVQLKGGPKRYSYVRYFFSNLSEDIKGLFCEQCDRLGIKWSTKNPRHVSVSDRQSVARLDGFVGPKK